MPPQGASPLGIARGRATLAAALTGFACMAAELTAVRLLAPHFGDSAYVWTNVIGVILAALAMGAWFGGRLAARPQLDRTAHWLLFTSGIGIAAAPWLASTLGALLVPRELPLDAAMPAMIRGSFVLTAVLFGPAMFCLGAVSPLLVTGVVRNGRDVGSAAGTLGAVGTLGSLVGTFLATHWLVPTFGCRITMGGAGALLCLAGVLVRGGSVKATHAVVLLVVGASLLGHGGALREPPPNCQLLAERESRMQFLQVLHDANEQRTSLVINEGLDSFHSLAIGGSQFTNGSYYDWHALAPLLLEQGGSTPSLTALSIGDAAGTLRAVYAGVFPNAVVDAVDIDRATMELGDAFFTQAKAKGARFELDGRVFLANAKTQWHVIHVDAYAHQVYVPAHLASLQFFVAAKARLHDGGVIACNVGALHGDDPVLRAIGTTMAAVFGHAQALLVPNSRNALLVARRGPPPDSSRLRDVAFGNERLSTTDQTHWQDLVATASALPWLDVSQGGPVLADDRPQLDHLLARSYVDRRDQAQLQTCAGTVEVAGAEAIAYAARQRRDWHGVLAAVADSKEASLAMREWAGDSRWSLRELRSAEAEYAAAATLAVPADARARIAQKRADVAADLVPIEAAERVAARNGWLQWAVLGAAMLSLWATRRLT